MSEMSERNSLAKSVPKAMPLAWGRLFASAPPRGPQLRLTPLMRLSLRLTDDEGTAALVFGFIEIVVGHESSILPRPSRATLVIA